MSKKAKVVLSGLNNIKVAVEVAKDIDHAIAPVHIEPLGSYEVRHFLDEFSKELGSTEVMQVLTMRETGYAKMDAAKKIMNDAKVIDYQNHLREQRKMEIKIDEIVKDHENEIKASHGWKAIQQYLIDVKKLNSKQIEQKFHNLMHDNLYIWVADEMKALDDLKAAIWFEAVEAVPMIQKADELVKVGRPILEKANKLAVSIGFTARVHA
jgi:hypothetical protein